MNAETKEKADSRRMNVLVELIRRTIQDHEAQSDYGRLYVKEKDAGPTDDAVLPDRFAYLNLMLSHQSRLPGIDHDALRSLIVATHEASINPTPPVTATLGEIRLRFKGADTAGLESLIVAQSKHLIAISNWTRSFDVGAEQEQAVTRNDVRAAADAFAKTRNTLLYGDSLNWLYGEDPTKGDTERTYSMANEQRALQVQAAMAEHAEARVALPARDHDYFDRQAMSNSHASDRSEADIVMGQFEKGGSPEEQEARQRFLETGSTVARLSGAMDEFELARMPAQVAHRKANRNATDAYVNLPTSDRFDLERRDGASIEEVLYRQGSEEEVAKRREYLLAWEAQHVARLQANEERRGYEKAFELRQADREAGNLVREHEDVVGASVQTELTLDSDAYKIFDWQVDAETRAKLAAEHPQFAKAFAMLACADAYAKENMAEPDRMRFMQHMEKRVSQAILNGRDLPEVFIKSEEQISQANQELER